MDPVALLAQIAAAKEVVLRNGDDDQYLTTDEIQLIVQALAVYDQLAATISPEDLKWTPKIN